MYNATKRTSYLIKPGSVAYIVGRNALVILVVGAVFGLLYFFDQRWIGIQWNALTAGVAVGQLSIITFAIVVLEPHHSKRWLAVSGIALFCALSSLVIDLAINPINLNELTSLPNIGWYVLVFSETFAAVFSTVIAYFLSMTVLWWPVRCLWSYKFYFSVDNEKLATSRLTVSGIMLWTTAIAALIALTSKQLNIAYATGALLGIQCLALPTIATACWAAFHTGYSRWGPLCIACVAVVALEILVLSLFVNQLLGFSWLAIVFNVVMALIVVANLVWLKGAGVILRKTIDFAER